MNANREHDDALRIYLNDHLAGATAGVELSRRIAQTYSSSARAVDIQRVADDIAEDRRRLVVLMYSLKITPHRYKVAMGWAAEKLGRLKPNGRLCHRSGLSSLIELETLRLGLQGKVQLWQALLRAADTRRDLDAGQLRELMDRAARQMSVVDDLHAAASTSALTPRQP